jgi:hypothetical protein
MPAGLARNLRPQPPEPTGRLKLPGWKLASCALMLKLDYLPAAQKAEMGTQLIDIYRDEASPAAQLEYSRMYLLRPFALDGEWNSDVAYVRLYNEAVDDFSRRELLLAMGRSRKDFWFRHRKQYLQQLEPWLRRAFIYGASCLPADEYRHWIRGVNGQLDELERAIALWARKNPIN